MKIKDILKEDQEDFKFTKTGTDPETGQVSWDVEYTPMIRLRKEVEELYEAFKKTLGKYPDDQKLEKFFEVYSSFKRQFKTHVNRKYGR
jgi:hypothetical protein